MNHLSRIDEGTETTQHNPQKYLKFLDDVEMPDLHIREKSFLLLIGSRPINLHGRVFRRAFHKNQIDNKKNILQ